MFRQRKGYDSITISLPDIVDVRIDHDRTSVNFNEPKQSVKKIKQKNRDGGTKNKNEAQKEVSDEDKLEEASDAESNELPKCLSVGGKYDFNNKRLVLCFWAKKWEWSLVSIRGVYKFNNFQIPENSFQEITGDDFTYNVTPTGENNHAKVFKVDISRIDRHVLKKHFSVEISYIFLGDVDMNHFRSNYIFDLPYFQNETKLKFKFLGHFHADERITTLYNYKFKLHPDLSASDVELLREIDHYQRNHLTTQIVDNSSQMIKYALSIEDLETQDELKEFTLQKIQLEGIGDSYWFPITEDKLPEDYNEMSLCFVPMNKYQKGKINFEKDCIYSQIQKYENGEIRFDKKFPIVYGLQRTIDLQQEYCLRFIPNRITYRACFQAFDMIQRFNLHNYFNNFEERPANNDDDDKEEKIENFEWLNDQIANNQEQMTAIKNIVNCTAYPFPYVVFGPPGTGKTSLIIECIAQILKARPTSRILVTAQSNSACDEVGVRLLNHISRQRIYRFYSPSLLNPKSGETSQVLRETSNLRNKRNDYPTKEEFYHFNVVIVTLMTCSRLVQLDVGDMNRHFDYIFVDECAAATEPEAYVPIVGLGTVFTEITSNIVLLGDHKQLGPVINSDIAERLGLGVSLMERIMSKPKYKIREDNSYDENYVTQLLDNFRSHPAILQFSNVLFYNSKLRAMISEPERSLGTRWNFLQNKKFPILFHCNKTPSKIVKHGTSSFNNGEIDMVRFYVDLLLNVGIDGKKCIPDDIGIVSPYKAQLQKLKEKFRNYGNLEIGTAEYYQGREKRIIIISTVKSRDNVGFLKSERRLNVCITRAKTLLILIGNADTLQQNSLWNSFMHFCKANNSCCGDAFQLKRLTDEEQKILDELNTVFTDLSIDGENEVAANSAIEKDEKLKAIKDRMEKLKELMKEMQ
ncbi:CLUMA_CG002041, isoform A [Clunio marinus]|uniref:CLUMA_CG002041, isoform A n=1 Tax=Clunio marinus TaxID=568069 RepID=A0A1J1HJQ9_9DIPT|nr:CLUMA_CG002041, isoform A [Clunio marinus]